MSSIDDGIPQTPTIVDAAYDTNTDPYYERVFHATTHENLSYGFVGNAITLEIISENT